MKKSQRQAAAKVIREYRQKPESDNPVFFEKHHIYKLKEHFDSIHVMVHNRTAQQVRDQYPNYPKSKSALNILRKEEPEIAKQVEQKHKEFVDAGNYFFDEEIIS